MPTCNIDPAEIRASLPAAYRPEFDATFLAALVAAGRTFSLDGVHDVIATWEKRRRRLVSTAGRGQ